MQTRKPIAVRIILHVCYPSGLKSERVYVKPERLERLNAWRD